MVRERAVQGVEQVVDVVAGAEDFLGEEVGHAVGEVHGDGDAGEVLLELAHEGEVVVEDLLRVNLSALLRHGGGDAFLDPGLDLAQTGVVADGLGVGRGDLHAVVGGGVMRGRNLDGSVEAVVRRAEIHHGRGAQADVVHIGTRVVDALDDGVMDFRRGDAAVAAHQDLVGLQQPGN